MEPLYLLHGFGFTIFVHQFFFFFLITCFASLLMELKMSTNSVNEDTSVRPHTRSPYVSKKTVAQGMLDVALLSSHTSQLVQILSYHSDEATTDKAGFRKAAIVLLIISITLQIIVGVLLITIGILDGQLPRNRRSMSKTLNSITTILVFVITAISVVIPSFTVGHASPHHYEKSAV